MLTVIIKPHTRNYYMFTVCELYIQVLNKKQIVAIVHTTLIGIWLGLYISTVYFNIKIYSSIL